MEFTDSPDARKLQIFWFRSFIPSTRLFLLCCFFLFAYSSAVSGQCFRYCRTVFSEMPYSSTISAMDFLDKKSLRIFSFRIIDVEIFVFWQAGLHPRATTAWRTYCLDTPNFLAMTEGAYPCSYISFIFILSIFVICSLTRLYLVRVKIRRYTKRTRQWILRKLPCPLGDFPILL